jgi:type IV fimbrial biogenesis protein FimT
MKNSLTASGSGFTLVELMVVLAIAAILMAVAGPSFTTMIASNNTNNAVTRLANSFSYTRSEAVTRGANVTICASTDFATCSALPLPPWGTGWIVLSSTNQVLRVEQISNLQITYAAGGGESLVCFNRLGRVCAGGSVVTFTATAANGDSSLLNLSLAGLVSLP